jgi:hypothetical protein
MHWIVVVKVANALDSRSVMNLKESVLFAVPLQNHEL